MTLGEIITSYTQRVSVTKFLQDSGISKSYYYMLINNKGKSGDPVVPSIDTLKKIAKGIHVSFDTIISQIDDDLLKSINENSVVPVEVQILYSQLPSESKEKINQAIKDEYKRKKKMIDEYRRVINLSAITNIHDAKILLEYSKYFGGLAKEDQLIKAANIIANNHISSEYRGGGVNYELKHYSKLFLIICPS